MGLSLDRLVPTGHFTGMFDVKIPSIEKNLAGLSLREAHKRRTSSQLRHTALRLFLSKGFDATTAEDIAEKAGVSVRTFFRYFATKDEVVFKGQGAWAKAVIAGYLRQPQTRSATDAICEALIEAAENMDRKSVKAYAEIVEKSQILRGKAAQLVAISIHEIAMAVAKRRGLDEPDAQARLFTEVAVATYQMAVKDWRDGSAAGLLEALIRDRFRLLLRIFGNKA